MKTENNAIVFDSAEERALYEDLKEYLIKSYKKKSDLKRLVNNIGWFMSDGRGDFFGGFVFCTTSVVSAWGIYDGGQDHVKKNEYEKFMQNYAADLRDRKDKKDNLVCFAIVAAYNTLTPKMKEAGLIVEQ